MVASSKSRNTSYGVGDEVSYAFGSGIAYGEVVRLLEGGAAVEILLKTGGAKSKNRETGRCGSSAAPGASELEETFRPR